MSSPTHSTARGRTLPRLLLHLFVGFTTCALSTLSARSSPPASSHTPQQHPHPAGVVVSPPTTRASARLVAALSTAASSAAPASASVYRVGRDRRGGGLRASVLEGNGWMPGTCEESGGCLQTRACPGAARRWKQSKQNGAATAFCCDYCAVRDPDEPPRTVAGEDPRSRAILGRFLDEHLASLRGAFGLTGRCELVRRAYYTLTHPSAMAPCGAHHDVCVYGRRQFAAMRRLGMEAALRGDDMPLAHAKHRLGRGGGRGGGGGGGRGGDSRGDNRDNDNRDNDNRDNDNRDNVHETTTSRGDRRTQTQPQTQTQSQPRTYPVALTVLGYPNDRWDAAWAGNLELLPTSCSTLDTLPGETVGEEVRPAISIAPLTNRTVVFRSEIVHRIGRVDPVRAGVGIDGLRLREEWGGSATGWRASMVLRIICESTDPFYEQQPDEEGGGGEEEAEMEEEEEDGVGGGRLVASGEAVAVVAAAAAGALNDNGEQPKRIADEL